MEDKKTQETKVDDNKKTADKPVVKSTESGHSHGAPVKRRGGRMGSKKRRMSEKPKDDFDQRVLDLARVTRVMAGGKRMKFRATMVIGDRKGKVGIGIAKGADVSMAISKAVAKAKKNLIEVPIVNGTVPHEVRVSDHSAKLIIRPARSGNGIKAGGVMRVVFDLAGIKDVVAKILGTTNKVNNAKATIKALNSFVPQAVQIARANKKTVKPLEEKGKKVFKKAYKENK